LPAVTRRRAYFVHRQIRQGIAIFVDEHFMVLSCSISCRLASLATRTLLSVGLSFLTLQSANSNPVDRGGDRATEGRHDTAAIADVNGEVLDLDNSPAANEPVDVPIVVAKHVMLHDGEIIEWADVEKLVTALPNPKLARPGFYFTHGALPSRQEEIRAKIFDFRRRQEMVGHSWGSISPRTSIRYDVIRTAADLVPNGAWRVNGTVETVDGLPIDGAEVVLCMPVDESLPYKTLDIYLREARLREPIDEVVTTSDNAGRFAVYPPPDTPYYVVALHKEGFGLARSNEFAKNGRVMIQPWARIRGRMKQDGRFTQSASVNVDLPAAGSWPELQFHHYSEDLGPASPDGRFEFDFIPPSLAGSLSRSVKGEQGVSYGLPAKEFRLAPGETWTVDVEPPSDAEVKQIDELKSDTEQRRRN
jgi:hypothetical protein